MQQIPPPSSERIEVIDVLRGFTLLGIAMVHFTEQYYAGMAPQSHDLTGTLVVDKVASAFVGIFISGKFYMIFSFLFGMSFFLQLDKSDGSSKFIVRFLWRLAILFIIGVIHQVHYRGDILTVYAVLGVGLLISHKLPDRILLILALVLVFDLPSLATRGFQAIYPSEGPSFFNQDQKPLELYFNTVKSGSYISILKANLADLPSKFEFQVWSGRLYITMGLFLLGLYAGRKNVFGNPAHFKKLIRLALWTLLGCILCSVVIFGSMELAGIKRTQSIEWMIGGEVYDVFNACLATIYTGLVVILFQKDRWRKRLMVFYAAGRMGLTTYLSQAVVGTLIFFSIGLGQLGEFGAAVSFLFGVAVFAAQIIFSNLWLRNFQYGPVEWLWRSLTYFRVQPLRK